eukprot:9099675-Lingulodinium_polyedra.AAC.1
MGYDHEQTEGQKDSSALSSKNHVLPGARRIPTEVLVLAVKQSTHVYRLDKLNIKLPDKVPTFGHR